MTLSAQLEADFLRFDGLEAVTFITRRDEDTEHEIEYAHPSEISHRDQELGTVATSGVVTRVWNLRKTDLDAEEVTPREGDVIKQADGSEWTIRSLLLRSLSTRYRFLCTKGRD